MYGGEYMKHYKNRELEAKIHTFLSRKYGQYPELAVL